MLRNELYSDVNRLATSEVLSDLKIIDMDKLRKILKLWNSEKIAGNQSIMMLLTIDSFFKQTI